jgi:hypothetical protein
MASRAIANLSQVLALLHQTGIGIRLGECGHGGEKKESEQEVLF